jgi:rod shape determining protein RodA
MFLLFLLLLLGSSLLILSTASINVDKGQPYHYVKLQALWISSGLLLTGLIAVIDYQKWRRFSKWIYVLNIVLLLAVILIGNEAKGATRWINITSSFAIQPSEFAKVFIILTLADFLAKREKKLNRYRDFVAPFIYVLAPMVLICLQPDLGTALVFGAIFVGMMLVAGVNPRKFGIILLGGVLIIALALWLHFATNLPSWLHFVQGLPLPLKDYQLKRLAIFLNPASDISGDGFHIIQSIWAIGSGGLWGKGYRMGTQGQLNFLPEHHTDFIFSVVGEEFGFIGTVSLLFFFFIFLLRAISIAAKSRDLYGTLIAVGIISMFTFHILVNVGMTSGIMPVTGIPLPLISYGGNNMLSNMLAIGLLLSINIRRQKLMF